MNRLWYTLAALTVVIAAWPLDLIRFLLVCIGSTAACAAYAALDREKANR